MSKTTKSSKKQTMGYIGCVYGGIMKQGHVRYFVTSDDIEDHFETFKQHYGSEVRGRYVKTPDQDKYFDEVKEKVSDNNVFEDIYELSVDSGIRAIKDVTGVKKASLLGEDHEEKADKGAETEPEEEVKTKKTSKKEKQETETKTETKSETKQKKVAKKIEKVESESEDEPSDAEESGSESESEDEKPAAKKKTSKKIEVEEKSSKTTKSKGKSK